MILEKKLQPLQLQLQKFSSYSISSVMFILMVANVIWYWYTTYYEKHKMLDLM